MLVSLIIRHVDASSADLIEFVAMPIRVEPAINRQGEVDVVA